MAGELDLATAVVKVAERDDGEDAGADEQHRRTEPHPVTAEGGDEDEQHAARHERLAAASALKAKASAITITITIASPASVAQPTVVDHGRDRGLELRRAPR